MVLQPPHQRGLSDVARDVGVGGFPQHLYPIAHTDRVPRSYGATPITKSGAITHISSSARYRHFGVRYAGGAIVIGAPIRGATSLPLAGGTDIAGAVATPVAVRVGGEDPAELVVGVRDLATVGVVHPLPPLGWLALRVL